MSPIKFDYRTNCQMQLRPSDSWTKVGFRLRKPADPEPIPSTMSETLEARALPLVRLIEHAARDPEAWPEFLGALAVELGHAAVAVNLEIPGQESARLGNRDI